MKKWIIILIAIILIGATSSGVLAGRVYYKEMKTYEDYDKKELQINGLENIYIDSDVPVNVKSTQGPAYVEFSQKFTDIVGKAPIYELEVEKKESTVYITLEQKTDLDVWLVIKENRALCTVYLPQMTINKLSIEGPKHYNWDWDLLEDLNFDFNNINIKELLVNTGSEGTIYLDGKYEKVDITQNRGKLEMNSKLPADVQIDGDIECKLAGDYNKIKVRGSRDVSVDSELPAEVYVESNGNIILNGSYKQINIEGCGNPNIAIQSDTLCKANVYADQGTVKLEGAIGEMTVKIDNHEQVYDEQVYINTTVIPKHIDILGNSSNVKLMLPNNTPGIEVTYHNQLANTGNGYQGNDSEESKEIISDYVMQKNLTAGNIRRYIYGDASTKVFIQGNVDNSIYILDNGYISNSIDKQGPVKAE